MGSPEVGQLGDLADLFALALGRFKPRSAAILGIAGGNGLDRIDPQVTQRVAGFDFNPQYLDEVRRRHGARLHMELHCVDLAAEQVQAAPVELVHAALVFEHAGIGRCLDNAIQLVAPRGALSVVLQLPSEIEESVGKSRFPSIQSLRHEFRLIAPDVLTAALDERGFGTIDSMTRPVAAGKALWMGWFERRNGSGGWSD